MKKQTAPKQRIIPYTPMEIHLGNALIAIRTELCVMVTPQIELIGREVPEENFSHGFIRIGEWGDDQGPHQIMNGILMDCIEYIMSNAEECIYAFIAEERKMYFLSGVYLPQH